jgi:hypothetical protein
MDSNEDSYAARREGGESMTRKQLDKLTGTAARPDLWHFGPGGTLGSNLGSNLYDIAEQLEPQEPTESAGEESSGSWFDADEIVS